jgi:hypothetical protein
VEAVYKETNEAVNSLLKDRKIVQATITLSLGAIGGTIAGVPGLLSGLFGSSVSIMTEIDDRIVDPTVKFRQPSHVVAFYDLRKVMSNRAG